MLDPFTTTTTRITEGEDAEEEAWAGARLDNLDEALEGGAATTSIIMGEDTGLIPCCERFEDGGM